MQPAVILINTGSPLQADVWYIRSFLKNFMADRHVFRLPPPLHFLLQHIVPATRAPRLLEPYRSVFHEGLPPQQLYMQRLCQLSFDEFTLHYAFLYSPPQLPGLLDTLKKRGVSEIIALPLFPQDSGTTVQAASFKIQEALSALDYHPKLRLICGYYDNECYLNALCSDLQSLGSERLKQSTVYFSYHSLPCSYLRDPRESKYIKSCQATSDKLARRCQLASYQTVFQSTMGPLKWQGPLLRDALLSHDYGSTEAVVICPGFAMDCLETLYEIDRCLRHDIYQHTGQSFTYLPCLNASAGQIKLIKNLAAAILHQAEQG